MDFEEEKKLLTKKIMEAYNNALHEEMKSNYLFFGFCLAFAAFSVFAILSN